MTTEKKRTSTQQKYPEPRKEPGPGWWLTNPRYRLYMIRELTSFFISTYAIIYIFQLSLLAVGDRTGYDAFVRSPLTIGFSIIALFFTLFHSGTWFYLMGRIGAVKFGPKRNATGMQSLAVNLVVLLVLSYVVVYLFILRG